MNEIPGVGRGPTSMTSPPMEQIPEAMAVSRMYPDNRVSFPITIRGVDRPFFILTVRVNALPSANAISLVIGCLLAIPLIPSVPNSLRFGAVIFLTGINPIYTGKSYIGQID